MSRWLDVLRSVVGKGPFPYQLWFLLEFPGRRFVHPPDQLAERLRLFAASRVLEVGSGSGFFSPALAGRIPEGKLVLLDLSAEFLARARSKLSKLGFRNFACAVGNACTLPFRDNTFDAAMMVTILGETTDRQSSVFEICRVLRPGGILSVTELRLDPHFVSLNELDLLVSFTSFERIEVCGSALNYTATFRKRPDESPQTSQGAFGLAGRARLSTSVTVS